MNSIEYLDAVNLFGSMLITDLGKTLLGKKKKEATELCVQTVGVAQNLLKKMEHIFNKCGEKNMQTTLAHSIKQIQDKIDLLKDGYIPEFFILIVGAMAYIGGTSQVIEHHFIQELLDYEPA